MGRPYRYLIAALPLLFAATAQAQQLPVFRAGVELLEVDVSVLDDDGEPVRDLTASDFAVSVDGAPRRIVAAQFIDLARTSDPGGPRGAESAPDSFSYTSNAATTRGRLIMLAVDRENIAFGEGRRVMRTGGEFLDTLAPHDQVALVSVPSGPSVDFTTDHQLVRERLGKVVGQAGSSPAAPAVDGLDRLSLSEAEALLASGWMIGDPQGGFVNPQAQFIFDRYCSNLAATEQVLACQQMLMERARFVVMDATRRTKNSVWALERLLRGLRDIEGRKFIVWIAEKLNSDHGADLFGMRRLAAEAQVSIYVILLSEPLDASRSSFAYRDPLFNTFDRYREDLGLQLMADYTGGSVHRALSDGEYAFERIGREISGYYLLAVEPLEDDLDGNEHDIEVAVSREGVHLRARRQVIHRSADEDETVKERMERLLTSPVAVPDLPLRVATYVYEEEEGSDKVRVLVATDVERDPAVPEVTFGYALVDADGKALASRAAPAQAGQGDSLVEQFAAFIVEPGRYTLKLAAVESGGRHGSLTHWFDACQMADLPFAMGDLMLTAASAGDAIASRPQVEPRLITGRLRAYLELYADEPVGLERLRVRTDVARTLAGAPLFSVTNALGAIDGATTGTVSTLLRLDAFPPGPYVVRVAVTRNGEVLGRRWRSFRIEHAPGSIKGFAWKHAQPAAGVAAPEPNALAAPPETGCRLLD